MKKTLLLLCLCWTTAGAQNPTLRRVAARYGAARTASAVVTKTRHASAVASDVVTRGTLSVVRPDRVSIVTDGGQDRLVMDGTRFTMASAGHEQTTDSRRNPQFSTFHAVLHGLINGAAADIERMDGVTVGLQAGSLVIVIDPQPADAKARRRRAFTSFVLEIDVETSAFKTLRMQERGDSYTVYAFTNFVFDD